MIAKIHKIFAAQDTSFYLLLLKTFLLSRLFAQLNSCDLPTVKEERYKKNLLCWPFL